MQLALYRSERPEVFEDIIGQKHIVRILQNQIRTGTVSQAYLFSGTHGTGKTSTARILAKAVNCMEGEPGTPGADLGEGRTIPCGHCANCEAIREGRFVDCIELDAASNNGVDDLRAIIEMVKYPPTVGRYKVYIIDEVHMLSQAAENAFLKTLEEPPEHAIFILATTDPQKVRSTIRSRCMQLNFKRVTESELAAGMERICAKRGIEVTQDALVTIASRADGSVRDALSILEQCIAAGDKKLDRNLVLEYTGAAGEDFFLALTGAVASGDIGKALIYIDEIAKRGKDAKQILKDWLMHYRNLMVVKYVAKPGRIIGSSAENAARLKAQADNIDIASIEAAIRLLSEYINIGRYSDRPRILLETAAVRIAGGLSGASYTTQPLTAGQTMPAGQAARPAATGAAGTVTGTAAQAAGSTARQTADAAASVRPAAGNDQGTAGAPENDEPIEMIAPAPREKTGSPEIMWNTVVDTIAREDRSFVSFVGRHSRGTLFESGELVVTVRPNKIKHAEDKLVEITRIARGLYGQEVFVTLKAGDPEAAGGKAEAVSEQETAKIIDDDAIVSDIAADVESLFGMKPEITG
ncbi:MAG: DNA polymerase III subunit gamma/tau [Mogibacterium sp.]|nr:DNA polymerase III subunit gamma/tau [Mogibacterium sp.]